jgi:type III secretion protein C
MSAANRMIRRFLLAGLLVGSGALQAGPVPWPEAAYTHFSANEKLEAVLADFAGSFSLSLSLSPGITGAVNGKFTSVSPTEFMTKLAGVYGFVWYTHAGTLFVSKASDLATRSIVPPGGSIASLRKALTELGVLDARFGWGELPEQGVVLLSGPPSYVSLIDATVRGLPSSGRAQQAAVFRLHNASAEDRTILYRDQQITIPGLATILRGLISGQSRLGSTNEALSAIVAPLLTASASIKDSTGVQSPAVTNGIRTTAFDASAQRGQPTVQSDPRLNALIIQDIPERMPIYRALIDQLDVPTALIEIEAMIIDVNTERAKELGISWGSRRGGTAIGFGNLSATPDAGSLSVVRSFAGSVVDPSSLIVNAGDYLLGQIRILETKGDARIQSRPSVITMDNIGALLDLSETFYIRVQGERVANVTPITAGTTLKVTPRVVQRGNDQMVQLMIDIEDGQIQDRRIDSLPTVRRSTVSTQAIVKSDDTLLIAGHTQDQNIDGTTKVPLLGDIPGLGVLFSNRSTSVQRRERLFMIKPRIISFPVGSTMGVSTVMPSVPATQSGFMVQIGAFDSQSAEAIRVRAAFTMEVPLDVILLKPEGKMIRVVAGPFVARYDAMTAAQKIERSMNLQTKLIEPTQESR